MGVPNGYGYFGHPGCLISLWMHIASLGKMYIMVGFCHQLGLAHQQIILAMGALVMIVWPTKWHIELIVGMCFVFKSYLLCGPDVSD